MTVQNYTTDLFRCLNFRTFEPRQRALRDARRNETGSLGQVQQMDHMKECLFESDSLCVSMNLYKDIKGILDGCASAMGPSK